jgi:hypothetical protein
MGSKTAQDGGSKGQGVTEGKQCTRLARREWKGIVMEDEELLRYLPFKLEGEIARTSAMAETGDVKRGSSTARHVVRQCALMKDAGDEVFRTLSGKC